MLHAGQRRRGNAARPAASGGAAAGRRRRTRPRSRRERRRRRGRARDGQRRGRGERRCGRGPRDRATARRRAPTEPGPRGRSRDAAAAGGASVGAVAEVVASTALAGGGVAGADVASAAASGSAAEAAGAKGAASAVAGGTAAGAAAGGAAPAAEKGKGAAAAGGESATAEKGAAPSGGEGAKAAAGPAAAPSGGAAPAPETPKINKDPHADPAFNAMKGRSKGAAGGAKSHAPAKAGAANAQAAAAPPSNDASSQAQAAQVDEMSTKEPGAFDREAFIAAVKQAIESQAPKNLEDADKFKEGGAEGVKGEVTGHVKKGKEGSEKDIKEATNAPPDASKAKPKQVEPMVNEPVGEGTASVGATGAMPPPTPAAATDLSSGPDAIDAKMAEADVTEEQIKKSNEPSFNEALGAKDQAKEHSDAAPADFRKDEKGVLGKAKGDAASLEGAGLQQMHGARGQAFGQAVGSKQGAKTADEAKRAKVANDIQGIYDRTKADVTKTLDGLDGKVDAAFSQGEGQARKQFENYVGAKMDAYKEDRYSGLFGGAKWLKDKLVGMPDEVNRFYAEGKTRYLADMDGVIGKIADIVGTGLTAARARIAQGKGEIAKYVAQLPQDLKKVGQEAEEKLSSQFEQLESDVESKQSEMVDTLARKYVESRDALDARIDEMKAANKGLVDKAMDAIVGVVKTIIQLKNMLLGVLAKAAGVIGDILADPIGFLGNLIGGIKAGLSQFVGNIATHLQEGLLGWLTGALGNAGITMPKTFDLKGIFDLVMQILGLTYANIRARVVKQVGEPVMARIEQTVDIFKVLMTEGVGGLWNFVKDKIGDFEDMVLGQIKTFIIEKVIKAGITWLIAFMNPAAAFIKACKAIYDIVMFIIERGAEIMSFVNSVLDSVAAVAKGNIGAMAEKVEQSLAKALPLAISFLASLLGLGGISEKIRSVIDKVRAPITKAIDTVVQGAVKAAKKLFGKPAKWVKDKYNKGKQWGQDKVQAGKDWAKDKYQSAKDRVTGGSSQQPASATDAQPTPDAATPEHGQAKPLTQNVTAHLGVRHTVESVPGQPVTMASRKGVLVTKANATRNALKNQDPFPADQDQALIDLIAAAEAVDEAARKADLEIKRTGKDGPANDAWRAAMNTLIAAIGDYCERYDRSDIDDVEEKEPPIELLVAAAHNMSPREYVKHWKGKNDVERRENSKNNGPGQFLYSMTEERVMELQKDTLLTGEIGRSSGGTIHAFKTYDFQIGWANDKEAFTLRSELTGPKAKKSIHSHPR